jgi:hypothetical protein
MMPSPIPLPTPKLKQAKLCVAGGPPDNRENRSQGGLYWSTYKAVVQRDGCFADGSGSNNFNEQLTEPIIKYIASPWEKVFSRRLGLVLSGLPNSAGTILTTFHNDVERRAFQNGPSIAALQMLK